MDVERTIEFLLDQQAKLSAGLDRLESFLERVVTIQEGFGNALVTLTEAQRRTEERLDRLAEAQQHTEERLNALIAVVNGMVRRPPGEKRE